MKLDLAEGPDVGALPISAEQIARCVADFGAKNDDREMWADCDRLAERFWSAPDDLEREIAWHHLLLAAGNFKRQTPIRGTHLPASLPERLSERPAFVEVPHRPRLQLHDRESWPTLCSTPGDTRGVGVATATTLLSALWPGEHVIIDQVAWSVTVGLRATEGWSSGRVRPEDTQAPPDITWEDYDLYSRWVKATATVMGVTPLDVERTLYMLGRERKEATDSWRSYGEKLKLRLAAPST